MFKGARVRQQLARTAITAAFTLLAATATFAQSETYPNRLVKIVHQYTPGGGNDLVSRILANALSERWHQSVVVEPRPGGAGIIGADAVAKAAPDGYTLLETNSALSMLPSLSKPLPFDIPGSFAPILIVTSGQFILVASNNAPYRSVAELITYARARPGEVPYSSVGVGSPHHLIMELFKSRVGIDLVHVPYKGAAPQMQDMVAGQVQVGFSSVSSAIALITSNSVRPLAVASAQRSALLPDIPTMAEAGVADFVTESWYGLLAPAGTPKSVVDRIAADVAAVLADPAMRQKLTAQDMVVVQDSNPASFTAYIKQEVQMWRTLVRTQNLKLD
jgi:tripartite-type tricarboxylate transporter receptor subunit TctC